jgi:hypothetical protein
MQTATHVPRRPVLFVDIDDVLCLNEPFGCVHVRNALRSPSDAPPDLWRRLFHHESVQALNSLLEEFRPQVVITSSWLSLLDRDDFIRLFKATGVEQLAGNFHQFWDAPTNYGTSRLDAIENWLQAHHMGEPILIIDDHASGESLVDSFHHQAGRALLCEPGRGFDSTLLAAAAQALKTPYSASEPWE